MAPPARLRAADTGREARDDEGRDRIVTSPRRRALWLKNYLHEAKYYRVNVIYFGGDGRAHAHRQTLECTTVYTGASCVM